MIHFLPESHDTAPIAHDPYGEAVARLRSLGRALNAIEGARGADHEPVATQDLKSAWNAASPAQRRCFDARSEELAAAAAAGLEAVTAAQAAGLTPHPHSLDALSNELRDGIAQLDRLMSL
ncbi:hypothetical protein [Sphingomicrobium nitratireducens]|uniref:hypothetical protein n=1 Tax=Sphingomicrobium nitratireducens TaxID=2964666 RepID=UPI00223FEE32|nr:hypothetical protein [Sphingomicrobium nitratireducens]